MENATQAQAADVVAEVTAPEAVVEAPVTKTPAATKATKATKVAPTKQSTDKKTSAPLDTAKYEAKLRKALKEVKNLRGAKNQLAQEIEAIRKETQAPKASPSVDTDAKSELESAQVTLRNLRVELALSKSASRVADPALAAKLLDQSAVTFGEDGAANIDAALEKLLETHPVLATTPKQPTNVGMISAPARNADPKSVEDLEGLKGPALLEALSRLARGR
jgi:seryl-tRNA synthetase